jgi:mono/diheme cytochrome c family protein
MSAHLLRWLVGPSPRLARGIAAALVVAAVLLASGGDASAQAGDAGAGKPMYDLKCALCHGVKGDGKGPGADLLDQKRGYLNF